MGVDVSRGCSGGKGVLAVLLDFRRADLLVLMSLLRLEPFHFGPERAASCKGSKIYNQASSQLFHLQVYSLKITNFQFCTRKYRINDPLIAFCIF